MHKSALIGIFLAVLELVRHHHVRAEQNDLHGEIWILPGERFGQPVNLDDSQVVTEGVENTRPDAQGEA